MTKAIADPPESTSSVLVYIYAFTVTDNSVSNLDVNTFDFQLVGTSNTVYHSTGGGASQVLAIDVFQPITLNPQQKSSGQVAFAVPKTDKPLKLEFMFGTNNIFVPVPAPVANVSWITQWNSNVTGSAAAEVYLQYITPQNLTATATLGYYYSGDIIALKLTFTYLPGYFGNSIFRVTSISASDGFKVVGISPTLPVNVGSSGAEVMAYLLTPATSFNGTLNIIANVNA